MLKIFNSASILLVILVVCHGLTACIPGPSIESDNPFDRSLDKIVVGSTKRDNVQQLLGEPIVSNDEWRVDVYGRRGNVAKTMIVPPLYSTFEEPYYALLVYDEDNFVEYVDTGAIGVRAGGFGWIGYDYVEKYLLAPKESTKSVLQERISLDECNLYFIPYGAEHIFLNGRLIAKPRVGIYFRWRLSPGEHIISIVHKTGEKASEILQCEAGEKIFAQVTRKYMLLAQRDESGQKKLGYGIKITNSTPDDLLKRHLVIYPYAPEIIKPYASSEIIIDSGE